MKKLLILSLLAASGTALASPCPKGNNSHLGDTTSSSATSQQQAEYDRLAASSANNNSGTSSQGSLTHQGFRTAWPH